MRGNWREDEDLEVTWAKVPGMKQPKCGPCDRAVLELESQEGH